MKPNSPIRVSLRTKPSKIRTSQAFLRSTPTEGLLSARSHPTAIAPQARLFSPTAGSILHTVDDVYHLALPPRLMDFEEGETPLKPLAEVQARLDEACKLTSEAKRPLLETLLDEMRYIDEQTFLDGLAAMREAIEEYVGDDDFIVITGPEHKSNGFVYSFLDPENPEAKFALRKKPVGTLSCKYGSTILDGSFNGMNQATLEYLKANPDKPIKFVVVDDACHSGHQAKQLIWSIQMELELGSNFKKMNEAFMAFVAIRPDGAEGLLDFEKERGIKTVLHASFRIPQPIDYENEEAFSLKGVKSMVDMPRPHDSLVIFYYRVPDNVSGSFSRSSRQAKDGIFNPPKAPYWKHRLG